MIKRFLAPVVFWLWNLTFLSFAFFGVVPELFLMLRETLPHARLPWDFWFFIFAVLAIPMASVIYAVWLTSKGRAREIGRFLFAVEAPIVLLCLGRLFLVREMNPCLAFVSNLVVISAAAALYATFKEPDAMSSRALGVRLAAESVAATFSLYLGAWIVFYTPPVVWFIGRCLKELVERPNFFGELLVILLGMVLFLLSLGLFASFPIFFPILCLRSWKRTHVAYGVRRTVRGAVAISALTSLATVGGYVWTWPQSQAHAFALLETAPANAAERAAMRARSGSVRDGLVNAYLASYRYETPVIDDSHIELLYRDTIGVPQAAADAVQFAYNLFAAPFHYAGGHFYDDHDKAAKEYQQFFDQPIQQAERNEINAAINATFDRTQADAGLIDIGEERVRVVGQDVMVEAVRDSAEIEIHEQYENVTDTVQEVFYTFSLPESAVVTGLWLGTSGRKENADRFVVSPRGAAQRVYREEVRRGMDPALLEQVGPRQYRLRIFPIPVTHGGNQARMNVWLRYRTFAIDGQWPLPRLIERRNVFWDSSRRVTLNGHEHSNGKDWLWPSLPGPETEAIVESVQLPTGEVVQRHPAGELSLPSGKAFAVVVDRTRSMEAHQKALVSSLQWLDTLRARGNRVELYLAAAPTRGEAAVRLASGRSWEVQGIDGYGSQALPELLQQFDELRKGDSYDAVVVLTDDGGTELGDSKVPRIDAPLWIVHLDGQLPRAYSDGVLDQLYRPGGGIDTTVQGAIGRFTKLAASGPETLAVADGFVFTRVAAGSTFNAEMPAQLAARELLRPEPRGALNQTQLNALHAVAVQQGVVTPFSSMIVLVNDAQRERLKEAEASNDRFQRETETGDKVLVQHQSLITAVSGTPEPSEWVLIAIAAALLIEAARRKGLLRGYRYC